MDIFQVKKNKWCSNSKLIQTTVNIFSLHHAFVFTCMTWTIALSKCLKLQWATFPFKFITACQRSCGKIMFSVLCVCLFTVGISCDHYPWCIGPHHTGTPRHVQTCSTWTHCTGTPLPGPGSSPSPTPYRDLPPPALQYSWQVGG